MTFPKTWRGAAVTGSVLVASVLTASAAEPQLTFESPDAAVRALIDAVRANDLHNMLAIFGPDGEELVATSDVATGRRNRDLFTAAVGEGWQLVNEGTNRKTLIIGNESWPFPVPVVNRGGRWQFDTAAGKEEVIARRIGRNELEVIPICHTYVAAQLRYAEDGHDGSRAGLYAASFSSDAGRHNGLYWPAARGERRSPLGDLVAQAAAEGRPLDGERKPPQPFHGYYFKILTAQGSHAPGGAKSYLINGQLSGGFALVAWPAQYDVTGVMTFVVARDGRVLQKDLGPDTDAAARAMTAYNPDKTWSEVR